ncbi:hypothetical protein HK102_006441, partial [Quaeritorhiza haematococci]
IGAALLLVPVAFSLMDIPVGGNSPRLFGYLNGFYIIATAAKLIEARTVARVSDGFSWIFLAIVLQALTALVCLGLNLYQWLKKANDDEGHVPGERKPSPEHRSSVLSRLSFLWLDPLIRMGNERPLEADDLWELADGDKSHSSNKQYQEVQFSSLFFRLAYVVRFNLAIQFTFAFTSAFLGFAGPIFMNRILFYIESPDQPRSVAWVYVVGLFFVSLIKAASDGQIYFNGRRVGTRVRAILVGEIYKKSLRRANGAASVDDSDDGNGEQSSQAATMGKIVTLMSVDTERIRTFVSYCHVMMLTPLQIIIAISALLVVLGWPAVSGMIIMLLTIPATTIIGKWTARVQTKLMDSTDNRVNIMNEVLNGIRIIKYFAWEPEFIKKILDARNAELRNLIQYYLTEAAGGILWHTSPLLVAWATFVTYTKVAGYNLDATTAFTGLALLNALRGPLISFPNELLEMFQAYVSLKRIDRFLNEEELEKFRTTDDKAEKKNNAEARENGANGAVSVESTAFPAVGFVDAWFTHYDSYSGKSNVVVEEAATGSETPATTTPQADLIQGQNFTLRDLNIEFPLNKLTVIMGSTGAGKSSLILALLGELNRLQGNAYLPDERSSGIDGLFNKEKLMKALTSGVAYCAQTSWLMNATIRENILFGEPYDPVRYQQVIRACALVRDFQTLDGGDLTEIGEKGINLSGGQKQRISLARAAYSKASIILLDDVLSAVDAPTAQHLFTQCILGIMADRTRLLVSHAVQLVCPRADHIVLFKGGQVAAQGSLTELLQNAAAETLFGNELSGLTNSDAASVDEYSATDQTDDATTVQEPEVDLDLTNGKSPEEVAKLVEDEGKATGSVRWAVYSAYLTAAGGILFTVMFIVTEITALLVQVVDDWWLKKWSESYALKDQPALDTNNTLFGISSMMMGSNSYGAQYLDTAGTAATFPEATNLAAFFTMPSIATQPANVSSSAAYMPSLFFQTMGEGDTTTPQTDDTNTYILVYGLIGLAVVCAEQINFVTMMMGAYRASLKLHSLLLNRIMNAPLRFFEVTPLGRIMNRFSKDIGSVDSDIMNSMGFFVREIIQGIVILCVITFITPIFLVAIAPIALVYVWVAQRYLNCSRELKRLDSVARSPIYAQFSETLTGVSTIRAYGVEKRFINQMEERVDHNHRAFFWLWVANRWLAFRIDVIAATVVFCAGMAVISGSIPAGLAGLSLTYALQFTDALLWTVRVHAQMEMNMNSVERVEEYLEIDQEPPAVIENKRAPASWPHEGNIDVQGLHIRYAPEHPYVLSDVTFSCKGGEKIGIVGRTGAGKSTLSLALFRILPISAEGGKIVIDGVDIDEIGLRDLRSALTIIPQDPVLFSGTVRTNLDPFLEHDDASLWMALKRVHFLESLQSAQTASSASSIEETPSLPSSSSLETIAAPEDDNGDTPDEYTRLLPPSEVDGSDDEAKKQQSSSGMSLDNPVTENGNNFSQGQRQLLCLARALLRRSRVVVLDEATASVDNETDSRIQETIRSEFADSTVLTIAHRLRTVMDYDKILVLDKGRVVEYDSPYALVQIEDGWFRKMCEETGEFSDLVDIARNVHLAQAAKNSSS